MVLSYPRLHEANSGSLRVGKVRHVQQGRHIGEGCALLSGNMQERGRCRGNLSPPWCKEKRAWWSKTFELHSTLCFSGSKNYPQSLVNILELRQEGSCCLSFSKKHTGVKCGVTKQISRGKAGPRGSTCSSASLLHF